MNNKVIAAIVVVALIIFGFWYFSQQSAEAPVRDEAADEVADESEEIEIEGIQASEEATVTYTDDGFTPSLVKVQEGGTVHFMNESSGAFWPASAMHPTHSVYPGSDIELCASAALGVLFDACGDIAPGETWSFTFNEGGEWAYHNHLDATHFGRVVVE
ncbi:MAG: hypothetical protein WD883_02885 [Candidatus Colwellbacteria bacterium]